MTFLNATLMLGIAAGSIPLVLHLIARREPKRVVFPSIRLLTKRYQSNRSRVRVRRWWLLALRILAIVAFAVALAQPAIDRSLSLTWLTIGLIATLGVALLVMATVAMARGLARPLVASLTGTAIVALLAAILWGGYTYASGPDVSWETAAPAAVAIVLDNSPTSAWKGAEDDRIARMQEAAVWMVTRLPPASRIAVVDRSAKPATFSMDVAGAISMIKQLHPMESTVPIAIRIDSAAELLRTSDLESRQVLVITDLARTTWSQAIDDDGALKSLLSQSPPVNLTVFDLGEFEQANRTLSTPTLADTTPTSGTAIPLSTTLALFDSRRETSLSVTAELQLYDNDPSLPVIRDSQVALPPLRSVDRTSVRVAPGGSSQLLLTIPPLSTGTHHGRIHLIGDDALRLDDVRYFTLRVSQPQPLLLIADDSEEARIMEAAVSQDFQVESIGLADLPVVRLSDYPAIIVIDPTPEALTDQTLADYVTAGGRMLICLGPAAGEAELDPALGPPLARRWRVPDPGTFFQLTAPSHPLLAPFAELTGGVPWSEFRVHQYWQLELDDQDTVLMRYAGTEHAALSERVTESGGRRAGRLLTLSTPLPGLGRETRRWNDLFSGSEPWPAFLLVRQFGEYLTDRGEGDPMSLVGQPQTIRWGEQASRPDDPVDTRRLQLFPPGGAAPVPLDFADGNQQIVIPEVNRSGTYWLRGLGQPEGFSANLAPAATDLDRIGRDDLDAALGPDGYALVDRKEEIELAEIESQHRVSLHWPVLLLALMAFLLEQVLGNRFYSSRAAIGATPAARAAAA